MDLWQLFQLLLTILLTTSFIFLLINPTKSKNCPPGPNKLPIIGNLHQVAGNISNLGWLAKKHGGLMQVQLGSARTLVISSAKMAKEVFGSHDHIFSGRPQLYVAKKLSYGCNNIAFSPPDNHWRAMKKMAIIELLSTKRVQAFHAIREEEVTRMMDSIVESNGVVDVSQLTLALASNVLCRAVFGTMYHSREDTVENEDGRKKLQELLLETQVLLGEFNMADFFPWFGWLLNKVNGFDSRLKKSFKKLDSFFEDVIEEHLQPTRQKADHDDLLAVLLRFLHNPTQQIRLSKNNVKGILLDMFIAGSDPAWATLVWSMAQLVKNPSAMKKAQEEVREAIRGKQRVEESDLTKLTYLKWVISETLRLHPPNPFPRETTEDCVINGFDIPAGTRAFVDAKTIGRDVNRWQRPDEFEPERFARLSTKCLKEEFCFVPFGIGRRGCPGRDFAMVAMEVALANLLYRFDWKLPAGDAVDMTEAVGLTTHKTVPLLLVATMWTN